MNNLSFLPVFWEGVKALFLSPGDLAGVFFFSKPDFFPGVFNDVL